MDDLVKISIVDDEALFVEGLSLLFSNEKNIKVVFTSIDGKEFLDELAITSKDNFPNIVLVDIQMKPMNGFELVELLKDKYPDLKIIILSSHYKKNVIGHMIKLGISAFIPKNSTKKTLVKTIESVSLHGVYFTRKDQQMLLSYMNDKPKKPALSAIEELSDREIEVLKLICQEQTNQEVANKLFLSKRTIESHRQRILDKIGAKNTVGLVIYAIANEIHPLPKYLYSV
ncbi:response regulator transcription factor [Aquimarina aggregata]|uniref:response regulator transcription factor n=1 Tax=Aquimarina aggregata TaxID=1642818 RepID=UPI00249394F4|nr:response regulator transcription factor [Aquimarina aggregata]